MKKLLSMLLFVATALFQTSCEEIDDFGSGLGNTNGAIEYVGAISVTNGDNVTYAESDLTFELEAVDNVISVMMNGVCFDSAMPYSMDIKISDIIALEGVFSADTIVPTINDEPQESRTLTDISGIYTSTTLMIQFSYGSYIVVFVGQTE